MQIIKEDVEQGVFMWVLRDFSEHVFYRTIPGDCFSKVPHWFFWGSSGKKYENMAGACSIEFVLKVSEKELSVET